MSELKWHGEEAERLIRQAAMEAINTGAEAILTDAIDEAPIKSGTLRRSGGVSWGLDRESVYVSFSTPYARRQHEELDYRHPRGGKAKYLEDPFNRLKVKVQRMAANAIKNALKGTGR